MSDFLLADGFGNLSDGTHTAGSTREILGDQWSSFQANFVLTDRADGRKWFSTASQVRPRLQSQVFAEQATISFACRVQRSADAPCPLVVFKDGSSSLGYLAFDADGRLGYYRADDGDPYPWDTPIATCDSLVPLNTETHIEVEVTFSNTVGVVTFNVGGVEVNEETGLDTIYVGSLCDNILLWTASLDGRGVPTSWKFSDVIVHAVGSAIGDSGVYYRPANADGADTDFTPSAGVDHYAMVDEIGPSDADYNESDGTAGHRDSYEFAGITGVNVLSVQAVVRALKTGSGAATLLVGIASGGSEDQSSAKALTTSSLTLTEFFDEDPDTASAWVTADVGDAEVTAEVGA